MNTEDTNTLSLTNKELHVLACIIGHLLPGDKTSSLISKVFELNGNVDLEDYDNVGFTISKDADGVDISISYEEKK